MQYPAKLEETTVLPSTKHYTHVHNSTTLNPEAEQNHPKVTQTPGPQTPQKVKPDATSTELLIKDDSNDRKNFKSPKSSAKKFTPRIII
jgi:hypothetical protein